MNKTVSLHERYKMGFIPWEDTRDVKKNVSVSAWTHFYHKPYQTDWQQAHTEAVKHKWDYINEGR